MNAFQPSKPPLEGLETRRSPRRTSRRQQRTRPYKAIALETTAKLVVNITLSAAAVGALIQLLPYHLSVQAKLQEMKEQVKQSQARVNRLKTDFNNAFDPQQAKTIMQRQTPLVDPTRRQIVILDKNNDSDEESTASP